MAAAAPAPATAAEAPAPALGSLSPGDRLDALSKLQLEGVTAIMARWTALQLAVNNGWGGVSGQMKADSLTEDVADLFEQRARSVLAKAAKAAASPMKRNTTASAGGKQPAAAAAAAATGDADADDAPKGEEGDDGEEEEEEEEEAAAPREFGVVYKDEVEDLLYVRLQDDFNTVPEDGSVEQVADMVCAMWRELQDGAGSSAMLDTVRAQDRTGAVDSTERVVERPDDGDGGDGDDGQGVGDAAAAAGGVGRSGRGRAPPPAAADDSDDSDGWQTQRR